MGRKIPSRIEIVLKGERLVSFRPGYIDREIIKEDFLSGPYKVYSRLGPCYRKSKEIVNNGAATRVYFIDPEGIQDG